MKAASSVRDAALVARFELLRAIRSRQALALLALYLVAIVGGAILFVQALVEIEASLATTMGVAPTRWPGTLSEQMRTSEQVGEVLGALVGDEDQVERLRQLPLLAIFTFWEGLLLVPFLACTAAAESLAGDVRTRAIRFEAQRTGRAELVLGRFAGQLVLMAVGTALAMVAVWAVGMGLMVQQPPLGLALALADFGLRTVVYAIPFVGLGVSASALTISPAWARLIGLAGTTGAWAVYGLCQLPEEGGWRLLADVLLPLLPQNQLGALWGSGVELGVALALLVALGVGALAPGLLRFSARDL